MTIEVTKPETEALTKALGALKEHAAPPAAEAMNLVELFEPVRGLISAARPQLHARLICREPWFSARLSSKLATSEASHCGAVREDLTRPAVCGE